jgi:DNA-directed RNA polymerase subunit RPC12/RpoP
MTEEGKKKVCCPYCGHTWDTGAIGLKVTCSSCNQKFWIKENQVEEKI